MGIFKRVGDLIKSNTNDLISRSEDPEKMINQTILDMDKHLAEGRKQVAQAIAEEKRIRKLWERELKLCQDWKECAAKAVRAGDDGLAKEALVRKREHEATASELQKQWEISKGAVDKLKATLVQLNDKIAAAKRKRSLLIAKKRRADAQKGITDAVSGMAEASAFETFDRMEKKIEQSEAEAEAAGELAEQMTGDTLSQKLAALESAANEDVELLALKEELGLLGAGAKADEKVAGELEAHKGEETEKKAEAAEEEEVEPEASDDSESSSKGSA